MKNFLITCLRVVIAGAWAYTVVIAVAWAYVVIPGYFDTCAESCSCTEAEESSAVNVQCGERHLKSVPIKINDKPVFLLNVSHNDLRTLEEKAFFNYTSVSKLYLQRCKLKNINEKAFQGLENLTLIDLSNNRLNSISPNLFEGNGLLKALNLQYNDFRTLQSNTPLLNGPPSLSYLDLQFCKLSNISSETFSRIPNLQVLDISRNYLVFLNPNTLSSQLELKDVNLDGNPLQCGPVFEVLLCWMHNKLPLSHDRTVKCKYMNGKFDEWTPEKKSSLCDAVTTPSVTPSYKPGISTSTTLNPALTPSHKTDISTSTTLNPAQTPSHKTYISTSKRLNPTISLPQETDNCIICQLIFWALLAILVLQVLGLLVALLILWLFIKKNKKCDTLYREINTRQPDGENAHERAPLSGGDVN